MKNLFKNLFLIGAIAFGLLFAISYSIGFNESVFGTQLVQTKFTLLAAVLFIAAHFIVQLYRKNYEYRIMNNPCLHGCEIKGSVFEDDSITIYECPNGACKEIYTKRKAKKVKRKGLRLITIEEVQFIKMSELDVRQYHRDQEQAALDAKFGYEKDESKFLRFGCVDKFPTVHHADGSKTYVDLSQSDIKLRYFRWTGAKYEMLAEKDAIALRPIDKESIKK